MIASCPDPMEEWTVLVTSDPSLQPLHGLLIETCSHAHVDQPFLQFIERACSVHVAYVG